MAEGYQDFVAGTLGGFSGKLLDYPFDTVKVLLQTQSVSPSTKPLSGTVSSSRVGSAVASPPPLVYRGAWHCISSTVENHGFRSLYRGIASPLLGSMAENAVLFLAYARFKRALGETPDGDGNELTLFKLALAGSAAGGVMSFVLNPFEVVKCRMQVQSSALMAGNGAATAFRQYSGPVDCLVRTIKDDGIFRGLYRGQVSLLMREIPGNFCWYGCYEGVCKYMTPEGGSKRDLGTSTHLLGGATAGAMYWTAFYPADTVGSQIKTNPTFARQGFLEVLLGIYRTQGLAGLYRGWGITVARAAPAHALIFAVYEKTMEMFRQSDKRSGSEKGSFITCFGA